MASIVRKKIGHQTYLYESESYRNEEGKPRNKRKYVGKIDPVTGNPIYKSEYLKQVSEKGKPIESLSVEPMFSVTAIKNSIIREFGAYYLFNQIANSSGLLDTLKDTFPYRWEQIFNLACYIVASGEPLMYCEDWIIKTECIPCSSMASQRISELFKSISVAERMNFYEKWSEFRCEQEYLALDITSISSYSELIADVEWGYNRDKEKLPQINLCLLMGEKTRLPVFQMVYSGSISDVSTLKTTLSLAETIPLSKATIVTDKGFCKVKNINDLLTNEAEFKFLIAMSFTLKFAKEHIANEKSAIDKVENTIVLGDDILRGVTRECIWEKKYKVFVHIYYDPSHANHARDKLYGHVAKLVDYAKNDPDDTNHSKDFAKYLNIQKPKKEKSIITIRQEIIENELSHTGWLVLVSNNISDTKDAISIYRSKDVVEKGFMRMKNCLDLGRLRVHSDNAMQNKVFIGFIALIITSYIHNTMLEKELYSSMTVKSLLKTLDKLRVQYINGSRVLYPITKQQKIIFDAFGFGYPM